MLERAELRSIKRRALVAGPADRPRPDLDPGTDLLPKIKHIVVLMMENHSFDNYLGTLGRGRGSRSATMARRMPRILTPQGR